MGGPFAEAVKVAFLELFLVNDGRDDFPEARVAKGRTDIVRPPGNSGSFFPLLAAFDTLNTQSVHAFPIPGLTVDKLIYAVDVSVSTRKVPILDFALKIKDYFPLSVDSCKKDCY
jgi:hypothetical protein